MTNADVIRQMTDDELYKFLQAFEAGDIDYSLTFCSLCKDTDLDCDECFTRWLFNDAHDYNGLLKDKGINSGYAEPKDEPQTKGSERLLKGSERLLKGKDEPQYDIDKGTIKCDNCSENGSYKCTKCDGEMYFKWLEVEDEPQTEDLQDWKDRMWAEAIVTEQSGKE